MKKLLLPLLLITVSSAAFAQQIPGNPTQDRVDRLERDMINLQRQVARGETVTVPASGDNAGGSAQVEVRISAIEEQMRELRGKLEEAQFAAKKNADAMEKLQRDIDFRLNEIKSGGGAAPPVMGTTPPAPVATGAPTQLTPVPTTPAPGSFTEAGQIMPPKEDSKKVPAEQPAGPTSAGDGTLRLPSANPDDFSTPREHYNYAFRLLNQTQYEDAASAFESFTKKYPKDPLVGNAYYWEGETFYIRQDYVNAADNFRKGFESLPEGPKAADNLLKLAMSLNALERNKEACTVLQQITTKFKKSSSSVTEKADQEQKRIGCGKKA